MVNSIYLSNKQTLDGFKFGLEQKTSDSQTPNKEQTVIKVQATSLNHRDVYIMKDQFMNVTTGGDVWSDMVGTVSNCGNGEFQAGDRVIINPGQGWETDPEGPEGEFCMLGLNPCVGTATEELLINTKEVFKCPSHLSNAEAAALPLAGLTAYRATFSKCQVKAGDYVLITGIGGGVALFALQFAVAVGANVFITSSDPEKIQKAIALGAKGGVNYKDEDCISQLREQLKGNVIRAIIDGAGGPLYDQYPSIMKQGGVIANYGQTTGKAVTFSMYQVACNIDLRGSTMGSRREFKEMLEFVDKYKVKPVVSQIFKGLSVESVQSAVKLMESSCQFGKIVVQVE